MPDLTPELLPRIQEHSLPGLSPVSNFVYPRYKDQSILNIPSTLCTLFGAPPLKSQPLTPEITKPLGRGFRRILLILMDALAFQRLQQWLGIVPVWQELIEAGVLAPLTSVVPSTTSSALVTLWTGQSPASHGIIGYEMWLKEYGIVGNMIEHSPISFHGAVGSLEKAGFSPESFLSKPTLGSYFKTHGVKSYAFTHQSIAKSGLSRMLMKDVQVQPFSTPASMWVSIRKLIEGSPDESMYLWAYWGRVDGISHRNGPDDERASAEFTHYSAAFEEFFLKRLNPRLREDTLVILTADHGQTGTPLTRNNVLVNHPGLLQHLRIKPTCENRMAFLFLHPGREEAVRAYFDEHWKEQFVLISQENALEAGLFGPDAPHPDLKDRIGDLIAIARQDSYLWWANDSDFLLGRHGSLHHEDMLVPFLAARL